MAYELKISKSPIDKITIEASRGSHLCANIHLTIPFSNDTEFYKTRDYVESITKGPKRFAAYTIIGAAKNINQIFGVNIADKIAESKEKYPGPINSELQALQETGKTNTIQFAMDKLHETSFIDKNQLADITKYIEEQALHAKSGKDKPHSVDTEQSGAPMDVPTGAVNPEITRQFKDRMEEIGPDESDPSAKVTRHP